MVGDERKRATDSSLEVKLEEQAIAWWCRVAVGGGAVRSAREDGF